jgi:3-dehydroquinate dehydratase-1
MICVSIGNCTAEECLKAIAGQELAEIRMDSVSGLTPAIARKIFSRKGLVATCRPGKMPDAARKELLFAAIDAGAEFVDVEVDASDAFKQEIVEKAHAKGCKVVVSFHDYSKTPVRGELEQIIKWCFESGADIAKIACKVESKRDAARLLGLLDSERKLVVVGMGKQGRITRIVAPLLGSQFTYASFSAGKETAPGQLEKQELEKMMRAIADAKG